MKRLLKWQMALLVQHYLYLAFVWPKRMPIGFSVARFA